jgi:hypothetical protein
VNVFDALAGQRTAEPGHHDRVAPHPHVGADVAQLNIPQPHLLLLASQSSCSALVIFGHTGKRRCWRYANVLADPEGNEF